MRIRPALNACGEASVRRPLVAASGIARPGPRLDGSHAPILLPQEREYGGGVAAAISSRQGKSAAAGEDSGAGGGILGDAYGRRERAQVSATPAGARCPEPASGRPVRSAADRARG